LQQAILIAFFFNNYLCRISIFYSIALCPFDFIIPAVFNHREIKCRSISLHVTALQWISEKLEWIRNMKEEEKETLKTELKKIGIKKIPRYVFYKEAYINLNIPLPQRVHDVMTYFSEFQTAFFISAALYSFVHYFLPLLPAPLLSISLIIEIVLTLSSFILIFCYLHWTWQLKVYMFSCLSFSYVEY